MRLLALIAALLVCLAAVLVAPKAWRRLRAPVAEPAEPTPAPAPTAIEQRQEFETLLGAALAAYHEGRAGDFAALFAKEARPAMSAEVFARLYEGCYRAEFGRVVQVQFEPRGSDLDPARASLSYACRFEKVAEPGWMRASFLREGGALRLAQLRFEPGAEE